MKDKIFTFKISLGEDKEIFRVIEIRGSESLYDFAEAIVAAFDFDFDHAFGFYNNLKNTYGSSELYELFVDIPDCEESEGAKSVKCTQIGDVFHVGKKMKFLFDYGDDWQFLVKCDKISEPVAKMRYPRVIEVVGKAPKQYTSYDEDC